MSSEAWKKIACPVSIRHALAHKLSEVLQIIWACTFYFVKKRKTELQIFSRLNKTTSKLQWIPRTAAYLQSFNNVYKSDKTKLNLFIHGMSCIQIMTCIRTGQRYIQDTIQISTKEFFEKIATLFEAINYFRKKIYRRCLTGSRKHIFCCWI